VRAFLKNVLFLAAFVGLSFAFFHLCLNNSYWHADDFLSINHNLRMTEGKQSLFDSEPPFKFQPLVYGISYVLFHYLAFDPHGYFLFNMLLHGLNAFLVYLLVYTLLRDRTIGLLSGLLFVFTVGNYGKSVMIVSGLEDLVITMLTLLTMIFHFRNELYHGGRTRSLWFFLALAFFIASIFTRSTSFSILGAFLAFGYFFRGDTGHRVVNTNFIILLVIAAAALLVKTHVFQYAPTLYAQKPGPVKFVLYAVKNVISYLVRMIFPIHTSELVTEAGPAVRFVYLAATQIRILIALAVISYSFFGFVFGNHTIRFFIAWTYIMVLPFAFFQFPNDWLNMRNLYLVSIGFILVLSAGAVYCSRLISHQRWRRLIPFAVPVFFILLARFVVVQLDRSYELKATSPYAVSSRKEVARLHQQVVIDGTSFRFRVDPRGRSGE
jgi:hypothetical protein